MKFRWWLVLILLSLCLGLCTFWWQREPVKHEAKLADGTIVRFEKVGKGLISYDSYPPLKVALSRYLPARFQGYLGDRVQGSFTAQDNSLGILVSMWTADGKRHPDGDGRVFSRIEVVESTGFNFVDQISGYSSSGNMVLMGMDAFPRRDRRLKLRCYERESDRQLFDIECPNPFFSEDFPRWETDATPVTRQVDPLTVTLKRGLPQMKHNYVADEDLEIQASDARWAQPQVHWQWWLSDATGNKAFSFDRLSPFESAWKLTLLIRRKPLAEFDANEVWKTERYPIPKDLEFQQLNLSRTVAGIEMGLTAISSRGILENEGGALRVKPLETEQSGTGYTSGSRNGKSFYGIYSGLPFIQFTRLPHDSDVELITTVRDQTGAKISLENRGWYTLYGQIFSVIQFEPRPESTEIEFEVIVNRARTFEFLVAPRQSTAASTRVDATASPDEP